MRAPIATVPFHVSSTNDEQDIYPVTTYIQWLEGLAEDKKERLDAMEALLSYCKEKECEK